MSVFSSRNDSVDVADQIAALRKDVSALSRALSKRGASAYREAGNEAADLYGEIAHRIADSLPVIKRQAHHLERTVRDNPARSVAVVGLAALALAATVVFARR